MKQLPPIFLQVHLSNHFDLLSGFYRAACSAARSSDENSVFPSVRLSVCQTRDLWQNGRKIGQDFYTISRMVGGGDPF